MKVTKLAEKIFYFEDMIPSPTEILKSLEGWVPVARQDFMETTTIPFSSYLKKTDNATFKALDVWFKENLEFEHVDHKLLKDVSFYRRGEGRGYDPHADYASNPNGTYEDVQVTILGYLIDPSEYEGGEIFFDDYDIYLKPALGSMVLFGNQVQHGVTPVTSGTRAISSQFLVNNKDYFKIMGLDGENLTKEDKIRLRTESPQYENKNGNI
jgi:hypothetical protein